MNKKLVPPPDRAASMPAPGEERPTLLLVGTDPMCDGLAAALDRHGLAVERSALNKVVEQVFVGAPDVVVLIGDAAGDGGEAVLAKLSASVATAVVPAILVSDDPTLDARLSAFRYGAVGVVERSASVDAMARRIAELSKELPDRPGETSGELGETTVEEVVELFSRRLRTGILAVTAPGMGPEAAARVVLRGDRPVTQAIEELVERVRPLVRSAEPLRFEFQESPTGKLAHLAMDDEPADQADAEELLENRRVCLIEQSPARADELVQALRDAGALVVVLDGEGNGLAKARTVDPDVVVVDERGVGSWAAGAMRSLRRDPRLRWASLLVVRGDELWPTGTPVPDITRIAAGMRPLVATDDAIVLRARDVGAFDLRLESIGPVRLLRALARSERTLHMSVRHPRATVDVDFAEGLVVGASARVEGQSEEIAGAAALAALFALGSGRVKIEPRDAPAAANVMAPPDDAVAAADRETAPLRPSLPPPSLPPPAGAAAMSAPAIPPAALPAGLGAAAASQVAGVSRPVDARELLVQLEAMLDKLRAALPTDAAAPPPPLVPPPAKPLAARAKVAAPRVTPAKAPPASAPSRKSPTDTASTAPYAMKNPLRAEAGAASPAPKRVRHKTIQGMPSAAELFADVDTSAPPVVAQPTPEAPSDVAWADEAPFEVEALKAEAAASISGEQQVVAANQSLAPPTSATTLPLGVAPPTFASSSSEAPSSQAPSSQAPSSAASPFAASSVAPASAALAPDDASAPPPSPASPALPSTGAPPPTPSEALTTMSAELDDMSSELGLAPRRKRRSVWVVLALCFVAVALLVSIALFYVVLHRSPEPVVALPVTPDGLVGVPPPLSAPVPPTTLVPPALPPTTAPAGTPPPQGGAETTPGASAVEGETPSAPTVEPATVEPATVEPATAELADADEGADDPSASEDEEEEVGPDGRTPLGRMLAQANWDRHHGELARAETGYLRVLRSEPRNLRAMAGLTRLHMSRHDTRSALHWGQRLVQTRPSLAASHVLLGDVQEMAGQHAAARRSWQRALELSPSHSQARRRLAAH